MLSVCILACLRYVFLMAQHMGIETRLSSKEWLLTCSTCSLLLPPSCFVTFSLSFSSSPSFSLFLFFLLPADYPSLCFSPSSQAQRPGAQIFFSTEHSWVPRTWGFILAHSVLNNDLGVFFLPFTCSTKIRVLHNKKTWPVHFLAKICICRSDGPWYSLQHSFQKK